MTQMLVGQQPADGQELAKRVRSHPFVDDPIRKLVRSWIQREPSPRQILVAGGFTTLWFGILAGIAGTRIGGPLPWWRARAPLRLSRALARLWPWLLVAYLGVVGRIVGHRRPRARYPAPGGCPQRRGGPR
jgi:hypothetical protein